MTGYGTNLRPKKLLKNREAAKTLFEHEIILKNGFAGDRTILGLKIVLKQFSGTQYPAF